MARRSLQASAQGIKKAKQAFLRKGWTQEYLAGEVGLETRQPIWKFFAGKPIATSVTNGTLVTDCNSASSSMAMPISCSWSALIAIVS